MNNPDNRLQFQVPCRNLRSKEMYHQSPADEEDQFSSGQYWCTRTHENFGPDGEPVSKGQCCNGRGCFGS